MCIRDSPPAARRLRHCPLRIRARIPPLPPPHHPGPLQSLKPRSPAWRSPIARRRPTQISPLYRPEIPSLREPSLLSRIDLRSPAQISASIPGRITTGSHGKIISLQTPDSQLVGLCRGGLDGRQAGQREHSDIVVLAKTHGRFGGLRCVGARSEQGLQALETVNLARGIASFQKAVGVKGQVISCGELESCLLYTSGSGTGRGGR